MTEYGHYTIIYRPDPLRSHDAVKQAREQRRKQLEAVDQRRRVMYKNFFKKRRLKAASDLVTID
jgi:hypothetical protein